MVNICDAFILFVLLNRLIKVIKMSKNTVTTRQQSRGQQLITKYYGEFDSTTQTTSSSRRKKKLHVNKASTADVKTNLPARNLILIDWLKTDNSLNQEGENNRLKRKLPTLTTSSGRENPQNKKIKMNFERQTETVTRKLSRKDSFEEFKRRTSNLKSLMDKVAEHAEHKKWMDQFMEVDQQRIPSIPYVDFDSMASQEEKPLDCVHLTQTEIKEALNNNIEYLRDIQNEKIYSKRHEAFKTKQGNNFLKYNVSMIAFSTEQKRYLAKKLHKLFSENNNKYYFVVLLPEVCLKIFMDTHKMTYDEAYKYLDEAPILDNIP